MQKLGAPMMEEEFFAELRRLAKKGEWHLSDKAIRLWARLGTWLTEICPICAVSNDLVGSRLGLDFQSGAFAIGLDKDLAKRIALAVDGKPGHDEVLRRRLLKACGITA